MEVQRRLTRLEVKRSQRKVDYLVLAFLKRKAMKCNEYFLNGLALGHPITHQKHSQHWLASPHALVGKVGNGVAVMGKEHPTVLCRPTQNRRIWRFRQACILNANHVKVGLSPEKAAKNVAVEVFVSRQLDHATTP